MVESELHQLNCHLPKVACLDILLVCEMNGPAPHLVGHLKVPGRTGVCHDCGHQALKLVACLGREAQEGGQEEACQAMASLGSHPPWGVAQTWWGVAQTSGVDLTKGEEQRGVGERTPGVDLILEAERTVPQGKASKAGEVLAWAIMEQMGPGWLTSMKE